MATTISIHSEGGETVTDRLALFHKPAIASGLEKKYFVCYRPMTQLIDDSSPVQFTFGADSRDLLDLKNSDLHVKVRITDTDGGNVTEEEQVSPINMLLHTLWDKVDIAFQGKQMTHSLGPYPYTSMLKTLKCLGADNQHLESIGFKLDNGEMDQSGISLIDPANPDAKRKYNAGAEHRGSWYRDGMSFQMEGPLLADISQLNRYLLNGIEISITLYRNKANFMIAAPKADKNYKVEIQDVYFKACYVKVAPAASMGIAKSLEAGHRALYQYQKSETRVFTVPQGFLNMYLDNIFNGIVPSQVMVCMTSAVAKNGSYVHNPFNFVPYDIRQIGLSVDGTHVPAEPLKLNFGKGQNYVSAYRDFMKCLKTSANDVGITMDMYKKGYTIFSFRLDQEKEEDRGKNLSIVKHGSLRLELDFGTALPEPVSLIVYGEYPAIFQINSDRKIEVL
jgi:hypothetical protein